MFLLEKFPLPTMRVIHGSCLIPPYDILSNLHSLVPPLAGRLLFLKILAGMRRSLRIITL